MREIIFFFKEACMKLCGQIGIFTCKAVNIIYLLPTPVFITADRIAEKYGILFYLFYLLLFGCYVSAFCVDMLVFH